MHFIVDLKLFISLWLSLLIRERDKEYSLREKNMSNSSDFREIELCLKP
jgi:hypothetical protein